MKMNSYKMISAAVLASVVSFGASAAKVGDPVESYAVVTFQQQEVEKHELKVSSEVFKSGVQNSTTLVSGQVALRESGTILLEYLTGEAIEGKGPTNRKITRDTGDASINVVLTGVTSDMRIAYNMSSGFSQYYIKLDGSQTVAPGQYNIGISASRFVED